MEESQDKLKAELSKLCDEKRYYDAAKLLVKIDDAEGIEAALWDMVEKWMWKLENAEKETYSYAHFLHGFCREFDAGPLMKWGRDLAVESYRQAAKLGNEYAYLRLAKCYEKGVPSVIDAAQWLTKAAEAGIAEAQCMLGQCYYNGDGVEKDMANAAKWFRLAAEQGDDIAQCSFYFVFVMAHDENIVSRAETVKWLTTAVKNDAPHRKDAEEYLKWLSNG